MIHTQEKPSTPEAALILLTGLPGAGKTSLCREAVYWARLRDWEVAGLLSLPHFEGPLKVGIQAVDLRSGRSRRLARLRSQADRSVSIHTKRWAFDDRVVTWGNEVLQKATPCDLLVIDELGPLELERGEGWIAGLAAVERRQFRRALVVIRPQLLATALARWPRSAVVMVEEGNIAPARRRLYALLFEEGDASLSTGEPHASTRD